MKITEKEWKEETALNILKKYSCNDIMNYLSERFYFEEKERIRFQRKALLNMLKESSCNMDYGKDEECWNLLKRLEN